MVGSAGQAGDCIRKAKLKVAIKRCHRITKASKCKICVKKAHHRYRARTRRHS